MKQIRIERFGPPAQTARCVDVPDVGEPAAWEVVVDVQASAVNPADVSIIAGHYGSLPSLPAVPGMEGVGRVVRCGASVRGLAAGDSVLLVGNETWTQRRRVPAAAVFKVDSALDVQQLAMLKVNPATALMLLREQTVLNHGDWVLQTAPLSGVGRAVMQLARHFGFRTANVVRRPEAVAQVLAQGGDVALQDGPGLAAGMADATRGAAIRLALDPVGGAGTERLIDCLARQAVCVNYGMLAREPIAVRPDQTIFKGVSLKGFWLTDLLARMTLPQRTALFSELTARLADGTLRGEVAACYPLNDIASALRHAEQPGRGGKVLLLPNGPLTPSHAVSLPA